MPDPSWADLEIAENDFTADGIVSSYVRAFSTSDGARVLEHLRARFLDRRYGPNVSDAYLRHAEGGRAVVDHIISMIKRGQK